MGEEKDRAVPKRNYVEGMEKLDHGAVPGRAAARKAWKQHQRGTVGMRTGSGVKFPGLRIRPQLCHWPALSVFPPCMGQW